MSDEEIATTTPAGTEAAALAHGQSAPREPFAEGELYAPSAEEEWERETVIAGELPPRPRRRLLAPAPLALAGVLLVACGFIGGVLVQKGQNSTTAGATTGLASRFAALRSAGAGGGSAAGAGAASGGFAGRLRSGAGAAAGLTVGEVSYIAGDTLYVSDSEGNTVKVTTSPAASITKTVTTSVHGIHPGDTVVVRGTKQAGGAIGAESVSVSTAGLGTSGSGLGALFGAGGATGRGGSAPSGGGGLVVADLHSSVTDARAPQQAQPPGREHLGESFRSIGQSNALASHD